MLNLALLEICRMLLSHQGSLLVLNLDKKIGIRAYKCFLSIIIPCFGKSNSLLGCAVLQKLFDCVPYYFNVIFAQKMLIPSLTLNLQMVVEFLASAACEAQGKKETGTDGLILPIHVYLTWIAEQGAAFGL